MKLFYCSVLLLLFTSSLFCQSTIHRFAKLSKPEKGWVFAHPFIAKKAYRVTMKVEADVEELKKAATIGTDNNGGRLDAFKHAYWMACLSKSIGSKKALKLGNAHEKGNKLQYLHHQLEETMLPDSVSSAMDVFNNVQGVIVANELTDKDDLKKAILNALHKGQLMMIKKDSKGNCLQCNYQVIDPKAWAGKWVIPKCLVSTRD